MIVCSLTPVLSQGGRKKATASVPRCSPEQLLDDWPVLINHLLGGTPVPGDFRICFIDGPALTHTSVSHSSSLSVTANEDANP